VPSRLKKDILREDLADGVTLYLGDCREILPTLGKVDAVVTDPPYGIAYKARQPNAINYGTIRGDEHAFDPADYRFNASEVIIWGGNNFANRMPPGGWIVWDKRCNENADRMMGVPVELAWCSKPTLLKIIRLQHGGVVNDDARNRVVQNEARYHPTQKPVRLMIGCIRFLSNPLTILDPFMGSGTTGLAAVRLSRKFIGIEIEPKYYDIARRRIENEIRNPSLFQVADRMSRKDKNRGGLFK
jgi:site-specific DNA-methyltransferase (adenine-specific)